MIARCTCAAIVITIVGVSGCTTKTLYPTGGSRAHGIVELSYEYGRFEMPTIDWAQGEKTASERCQAWDYQYADRFEGSKSKCLRFSNAGKCDRLRVTIKYQCVFGP